ncbi:MAG TPA: multidrug effflux MFS transporter [Baekduia sp.]|nr:multidrug effflux MFS transporter [Baekduia sp.]
MGGVQMIGPLSIDAYLPAFPRIADEFGVGASAVQFTLSTYMLGSIAGVVLTGPLSDRFGRKGPMLCCLMLFGIASLACAFATSIELLAAARVLEGFAAAAAGVLLVATVRDRASGVEGARIQSWLVTVMMVAPIVGPLMGSGILAVASWRWIFVLLAGCAALWTLVIATCFRETLPPERRHAADVRQAFRGLRLLADRRFLAPAIAAGVSLGALMAYLAGSSLVLQGAYGLSPEQFAVLFGLNAFGIMLATGLNRRLLHRFAPFQIMVGGMFASAAAALMLLAGAGLAPDTLVAVALPLAFLVASWALIQPNAIVLIMHDHATHAGTASSCLRVLQACLSAVIAPLAGIGAATSALPLAVLIAVLSITGLALTVVLMSRSSFPGVEPVCDSAAAA